MKAWWGQLSLRARLAFAFGSLAAGALVFLLALIARSSGIHVLTEGKIIPASVFVLGIFFAGGWLVAGWCLSEISRLGASINEPRPGKVPSELEGLASLLRSEARRRDQLLAELRRFTGDVSHELRRPVTALRTVGELALRQHADDPQKLCDTIGMMLEETEGLNRLLSRLLELARLESGQTPLSVTSFDAVELLHECRESLLALTEDRRVTIVVEGAEKVPLRTDRGLLRTALLNLLHNAIAWSPDMGEVILRSGRADGNRFVLKVIDHGPGIAESERHRLFERFYRGPGAHGEKAPPGSGLGLAIALRSIEQIGGTIELESTTGRGSTFAVVLPAQSDS
ncbi:HAMP domain-containing histidine kinase [Luteolibacter ambystomatis]|uniref:histidine kinase n=1 Tax=Luteolibacter ambystomatis TaxID=2824561 RepID=A0A975G8A6_9BACT|nr:HAMP domain-containing sensor histidine kinase [Luteolibacter ambystomatis]QUE51177.1 HAMP domain-containing histidine kinase [Luteolibacter ambystomatis]